MPPVPDPRCRRLRGDLAAVLAPTPHRRHRPLRSCDLMSSAVANARDKIDPSAPVFFLSYAHAPDRQGGQPADQNKLFEDFFEELSGDVAQLVSLPPGSEP